jgi:RNA polymerase sigma-70 factor (ECF subfamily)
VCHVGEQNRQRKGVIRQQTIPAERVATARSDESEAVRSAAAVDNALFRRFFSGDDSAFLEIFDRHTERLVGDRQAAEDLVQDVWERIMKQRARGAEPPDVPLALLYRIARNLSLNHIRDRRNHTQLDAMPESRLPSVTPREKSRHEELVAMAMEHLPINYREVLILHAYSDYRFDEIAEMLGEPVGAIRTRAWRARTKLARLLAALIGLYDPDEHDENETRPGFGCDTAEDDQ